MAKSLRLYFLNKKYFKLIVFTFFIIFPVISIAENEIIWEKDVSDNPEPSNDYVKWEKIDNNKFNLENFNLQENIIKENLYKQTQPLKTSYPSESHPNTFFTNNSKQDFLKYEGLSVSSALIPPISENHYSIDIDDNSNLINNIGISISESLYLGLLAKTSFKDTNEDLYQPKFALAGKYMMITPQSNDNLWLASRFSLALDNNSKSLLELVNTYDMNEKIYLNISPKFAFINKKLASSLGTSINLSVSTNFYLISELNLPLSDISETNNTFAIRYLMGKDFSIDFFITTAQSFNDSGEMLSSDKEIKGIRFTFLF